MSNWKQLEQKKLNPVFTSVLRSNMYIVHKIICRVLKRQLMLQWYASTGTQRYVLQVCVHVYIAWSQISSQFSSKRSFNILCTCNIYSLLGILPGMTVLTSFSYILFYDSLSEVDVISAWTSWLLILVFLEN